MEEQIASIHLGCASWRNSLASLPEVGDSQILLNLFKIFLLKLCGENDRILGQKEINNIKNIKNMNFVGLQNCGHLPHIDLPIMVSK